jgi:hypothetical protein
MRNLSSFLPKYARSAKWQACVFGEHELKNGVLTESLEIRIAKRADQLSQNRGDTCNQSLACWLQAAKEILSKDDKSSS